NLVNYERLTEEAKMFFENANRITTDKDDTKIVQTYNVPIGGTTGIKRVVESFQKIFGIYPTIDSEYFTVEAFKEAINQKTNELKNKGINIDLSLFLKKWILKQAIIAFFQQHPAVEVDNNGFIVFKEKDGKEIVYSIRNDQDSLARFPRAPLRQMKFTVDVPLFEGIRIIKDDGAVEVVEKINFIDEETSIEVQDLPLKLSAYTGLFKQNVATSNIVEIRDIHNNHYWISSTIFHAQFAKDGVNYDRYYIIKKDGKPLVAKNFDDLKKKIKDEYNEKITSLDELPFGTVYVTIGNGQVKDSNERANILTLATLLEKKLLHGEFHQIQDQTLRLEFALNIFHTALLPKTDAHYTPYISNYLEICTKDPATRSIRWGINAYNGIYFNEKNEPIINTISAGDFRYVGLMSGTERAVAYPILNALNVEMAKKTDALTDITQRKITSIRSFNHFDDNTNIRIVADGVHASIQFLKQIELYYLTLGKRDIAYVLPIGNAIDQDTSDLITYGTTKGFLVEVNLRTEEEQQGEYIYDLSNAINVLTQYPNIYRTRKKTDNENKIIVEFTDKTGITIKLSLRDLIAYQNNQLQDEAKIQAINNLVAKDITIGENILTDDATVRIKDKSWKNSDISEFSLDIKQSVAHFLAVSYLKDRYGNKALSLSIPTLCNALEALIGSRYSKKRIYLEEVWNANLQKKFGLTLEDLRGDKGAKLLFQKFPSLKEALIELYMKWNKDTPTYKDAKSEIEQDIHTILDLTEKMREILMKPGVTTIKNYLNLMTTCTSSEADKVKAMNDVISVFIAFAMDIYEVMSDYGRIKQVNYTPYESALFVYTLPSTTERYRKIWDDLHTDWYKEMLKKNEGERSLLTSNDIDRYIEEKGINQETLTYKVLQVIKDILTEKKGVIAPPFNEEGQLVTVDTEEKIYRELYDTV
ncbi:MAG: hypothetical protein ACTSYD_10100, partial [Candidatus Heimdallarchaeaceae archaeon]